MCSPPGRRGARPASPGGPRSLHVMERGPAGCSPAGMNVAVIFYSLYGNTALLASAVAAGAESAGATVRLLRVPDLAPPGGEPSPRIRETRDRLADLPLAGNDDLIWADGVAFGSPTRYGN